MRIKKDLITFASGDHSNAETDLFLGSVQCLSHRQKIPWPCSSRTHGYKDPPRGYHKNKHKTKRRWRRWFFAKRKWTLKIRSPTPELSAYQFAFSATSHKVCPVVCVSMSVCVW